MVWLYWMCICIALVVSLNVLIVGIAFVAVGLLVNVIRLFLFVPLASVGAVNVCIDMVGVIL